MNWFYLVKWVVAKQKVKKYQQKYDKLTKKLGKRIETEIYLPSTKVSNNYQYVDTQTFHGIDDCGNSLNFKLEIGIEKIAEASLHLRLADGNVYVFPGANGSIQTTIPKNAWKVAGLNVEVLEPFKMIRLTFNGLLKNITCLESEKIEQIQFSFIFTAFGSPDFVPQDIDTNLYARALASDRWRDGSWTDNMIMQYGFEQLGAIKGFIKGDSYREVLYLSIPGNRSRCKGISDRFCTRRTMRIVVIDDYGNLFNIVAKCLQGGNSQLNYGFSILSNERRYPISDVDIQMRHVGENKNFPDCIKIHVVANKTTYHIVAYLNKNKIARSISKTEYGYECYSIPADCNVDLVHGSALIEFWYENKGTEIFIPTARLSEKIVDCLPEKLVADITDEESKILDLTGGKGNSLALLSSLNSHCFRVPDGFIVTVKAYRLHLSKNVKLADSILALKNICCGNQEGDLKEACLMVVNSIKNDQIHLDVYEAINKQMNKYKDYELGWAVRSSALGEDSEELSAAGQNETFLGCQNTNEVLNNVLACWASLYSYHSVQYRWQHGLPIITDMAVVVQKMVHADSAGVLFTCHPSTSSPSQLVITSNFGLGETVVSGQSEPDTFILNRTWDDRICVADKTLGTKHKILKVMPAGLEESVDDHKHRGMWSISDDQAIRLGKVGIAVEQAFGSPRDIEWAFNKDQLYLLQSRPITTMNTWSDYELSHEMDTPLRTKNSFFTTANVREVIPKAASVLSQSSSIRCTDWAFQRFGQLNFDPLAYKGFVVYEHNILLDVIISIHRHVREEVHTSGLIMDLAIFGHPVLDKKINDTVKKRCGAASAFKLMGDVYRIMVNNWIDNVGRAKKLVNGLNIDIDQSDDSMKIYEKIDASLETLNEVAICHVKTSAVSVFYQIISMTIMLEGKSEITDDHVSDFAAILSSCEDVISAEVPKYLEKIAKMIKEEKQTDPFVDLDPTEGITFLKNRCPKAYEIFCEFIDKHGHRSLNEFEIIEPSWKENPSFIISMIQVNVKNERVKKKESVSIEDIVKNLKSSNKTSTKKIIKSMMQRMRASVGFREQTKSEMIKGYDKLRQAYRELGRVMVSEGLLPSKDLINHFTHQELGLLISKRSYPALLIKALRRQKLYPSWKNLQFPELMHETPKAEDNEANVAADVLTGVCKGTSVYAGVVQARACVIRSIDHIYELKPGDILITYSTDIGWTPYFPMLTGIVTELGGLVSHGAVVAREYGLPCIVGVQSVTKRFKTGDIIQLDGSKGELGKI